MQYSQIKKNFLLFASVVLSFFSISSAHAQNNPSYQLTVSNSYFNINYIDDMNWQKESCWTNASLFRAALRRPNFAFANTSATGSGKNISRIKMTLKPTSEYTFDAYFPVTTAPFNTVNSTVISPDSAENNVTNSTFELSFQNDPLLPGEKVAFVLVLKRKDGIFENFDFQNILWDSTGNNRFDNTMIQVSYTDGTVLPEVPFFEYIRASMLYNGGADGTSGQSYSWYCGTVAPFSGYNGRIFLGTKGGIEGYLGTYIFKQTINSATATPTQTATKTNTPYYTSTPTKTATRTNTPYYSSTPTKTPTKTNTPHYTSTPTKTATKTNTPNFTSTPTKTSTSTPTKTFTPNFTSTPTKTATKTNTPYYTATKTFTPNYTNTPSRTPTQTSTPYYTYTNTPTQTATKTNTPYYTATPTKTATKTPTPDLNVYQIYPEMNCVTYNGDGTSRFYLGYLNNNQNNVTIVAGTNTSANKNLFTIDNAVTNIQPSTFEPGRYKGEFSITVNSTSILKWVLQYAGQAPVEVSSSNGVPACQPVVPIVECIELLSPTSKLARLGYDNQNDFKITIPVGANNRFNPLPQDRGQPSTFFPGRIVNFFTTTFNGSLDWFLGPYKATATDNSPLCNTNNPPICEIGTPGSDFIGVSCQGTNTNVELDGSHSADPDGTALTYQWTTDCGGTLINSTSAKATLILTAPGAGQSVSCTAMLTVNDGVSGKTCQKAVSVTPCINDCLGNPAGSAQPDICGVCGGNGTACLDCLGVPNGSAKRDQCGVCNGNNKCLDCAGQANGTAKFDQCGVCNGNNACQGCIDTIIKDKQFEIDNRAKQILNIANKLAKSLAKTKNASNLKVSTQVKKDAKAKYIAVWSTIWSLPSTIKNCTNTSTCSQVSNAVEISALTSNSEALLKNVEKAAKLLRKLVGNKSSNKKLLDNATELTQSSINDIKSLPRFNSVCD